MSGKNMKSEKTVTLKDTRDESEYISAQMFDKWKPEKNTSMGSVQTYSFP